MISWFACSITTDAPPANARMEYWPQPKLKAVRLRGSDAHRQRVALRLLARVPEALEVADRGGDEVDAEVRNICVLDHESSSRVRRGLAEVRDPSVADLDQLRGEGEGRLVDPRDRSRVEEGRGGVQAEGDARAPHQRRTAAEHLTLRVALRVGGAGDSEANQSRERRRPEDGWARDDETTQSTNDRHVASEP